MLQPSITVQVDISSSASSYPIYIDTCLMEQVGSILQHHLPKLQKVLVITDQTVNRLYGEALQINLEQSKFSVVRCVVRDGEDSKSLATAERIFAEARQFGLGRQDAILALGGGVVGDLAGFCAATYYRGVQYIQVPTTLLAQVDSSVGGKVAVNFKDIKNGIGTFYQPQVVITDIKTLQTLPERQIIAGMAEVVKYALIEKTASEDDTGFFQFLMAHSPMWQSVLPTIIERCCRMKAEVVQRDEREDQPNNPQGRVCLNLGHTFAHAIESLAGYGQILHGEAVAMGMLKAFQLAVQRYELPPEVLESVIHLFEAYQLPIEIPAHLSPEAMIDLMRRDKKVTEGNFRFILPQHGMGRVNVANNVTAEQLKTVLATPAVAAALPPASGVN